MTSEIVVVSWTTRLMASSRNERMPCFSARELQNGDPGSIRALNRRGLFGSPSAPALRSPKLAFALAQALQQEIVLKGGLGSSDCPAWRLSRVTRNLTCCTT